MAEYRARGLTRLVKPAAEPLSLAEAKLFLRVDGADEDSLITDMIAAVREAAEAYLHKSLITQSWGVRFESYAPTCAALSHGPVQSITDVKSIDKSGMETVIDSGIYHISAARRAIHCGSVELGHEVRSHYDTGYGDAVDVPEAIRQGMLMHLASLYENRIEGAELPVTAMALYKPYREMRLA